MQDRDDAYAARRDDLGDRVVKLGGGRVADGDRDCRDSGRRGQRSPPDRALLGHPDEPCLDRLTFVLL